MAPFFVVNLFWVSIAFMVGLSGWLLHAELRQPAGNAKVYKGSMWIGHLEPV